MYRLLMLCALVAFVIADEDKVCCSMDDRHELLHEWESIWSAEFTGRRVLVAQELFKKLFEKAPETKALFKNVGVDDINSAEFKAHCVRVTDGLDTVIHMAFESDIEYQLLDHLGNQHAKYKDMHGDYFRLFRECFLEVLPQAVPCFNSGAWGRCLRHIQDEIAEHVPQ